MTSARPSAEYLRNLESRDQCGPRACASVIIGASVLLWASILWALGVI